MESIFDIFFIDFEQTLFFVRLEIIPSPKEKWIKRSKNYDLNVPKDKNEA